VEVRRWYIDAWAVRDGAAFASFRSEDTIEDAGNTVFLSVPALEPIPVGRISTALRATRGCFQAGFHDDDEGREVAFDDLDQVAELVRRGYLASGIGPGGAALPAWLGPSPEDDDAGTAAAEHLARAVREAGLEDGGFVGIVRGKTDLDELVVPYGLIGLGPVVQAFAEATLIAWEGLLARGPRAVVDERRWRQRHQRDLAAWYTALLTSGVWDHPGQTEEFLSTQWCPFGHALMRRGYAFTMPAALPRRDPHALLSAAPCPRWVSWPRQLTRITDLVLLALVVPDHVLGPHSALVDLVPALLATLVSLPDPDALGIPELDPPITDERRLMQAWEHLWRNLPLVTLPPVAEGLVDRYAWSMLDGGGPRRPSGRPEPYGGAAGGVRA